MRAIFVALLGPGQGNNFTYTATPWFTDVPATYPFFKWIQKMYDLGITSGCTAGTYCPTADTTNDAMAVFSIRARQYVQTNSATPPTFFYQMPPALFTGDVPIGSTHFNFIQAIGGSMSLFRRSAVSAVGRTIFARATPFCAGRRPRMWFTAS